jgi:hypothetical protein
MKILFLFPCLLLSFFSYAQDMRAATWVFAANNKLVFTPNSVQHIPFNIFQGIISDYQDHILNSMSYSTISDTESGLVLFTNSVDLRTQENYPISGFYQLDKYRSKLFTLA